MGEGSPISGGPDPRAGAERFWTLLRRLLD
jgi:hypothetical protein